MADWDTIDFRDLPNLPGMLALEERQFLYWLGVHNQGGPIVDLGTFLGLSAACMAQGMNVGGARGHITSYDLFVYGPWCASYDLGDGWKDGDDLVPHVRESLAALADRITLVKGDIAGKTWDGGPIETLFVDFTQNWKHHNHVCREFLPHLQIGGILAHQDYVGVVAYWLHIFMERYADHFELISPHIKNSTAAWRYVNALPQEAFEVGLDQTLSFDQMLALLDRSAARYEGLWRGVILIARARMFMHFKGQEAAAREIASVRRDYGQFEDLAPLIGTAEDEIRRWKS